MKPAELQALDGKSIPKNLLVDIYGFYNPGKFLTAYCTINNVPENCAELFTNGVGYEGLSGTGTCESLTTFFSQENMRIGRTSSIAWMSPRSANGNEPT